MSRNNTKKIQFPEQKQEVSINRQTYTVPTDFVKLPSAGKFYPKGHILHGREEVEVKYMTTKEEDILTSPSYNEKGIVFDKLIENLLVENIKANTLLSGDKNAILINARINAYGEEYPFKINCSACFHENELEFDLKKLEAKQINFSDFQFTEEGNFLIELPKTKAIVELQLLTGEDEQEIVKRTEQKAKHSLPEEVVSDRYRQMFVSVNGNREVGAINDFISKMPISDSRFLQKRYITIVPDVDLSYKYACNDCNFLNEGGLPITGDFFWPDI
jgi:hypothetical protein